MQVCAYAYRSIPCLAFHLANNRFWTGFPQFPIAVKRRITAAVAFWWPSHSFASIDSTQTSILQRLVRVLDTFAPCP